MQDRQQGEKRAVAGMESRKEQFLTEGRGNHEFMDVGTW